MVVKSSTAGASNWTRTTLSEVVSLQRGHDLTWRERRPGNVPVMGSAGRNGVHDKAIADGPGVVLGRSGSSFGQAHYCVEPFWPHNTALYATDFHGNNPRFIYYLLDYIDFERYNSGGAQQSLNRNFIANLAVSIPTVDEQVRIARALDDAGNAITVLEELITKKQSIKQGLMQQLLTGKTRLPGFKDSWVVHTLGDLLAYEQPSRYLVASTDYTTSGTPVLTAGKTFLLGYTSDRHGVYTNLPVIIFDDFTTASRFVDFPFKAKSSAMKMLSSHPGVNLRYMYERMQLIDFSVVDHKRRWIAEYSKIEVAVPELNEQEVIAGVLADVDDEISTLNLRLIKSRAIKLGMMQCLLTGRKRRPLHEAVA